MLVLFAALSALAPQDPPTQRAAFTKPDIHGDNVVFTCEGDLFLGNLRSGDARRITSDDGLENNAHFSPDGTLVAFSAQYEGGRDVYVMPTTGDAPRRLTYDPAGAEVLGWTPDGKSILYRSRRNSPVGGVRRLYLVPVGGGLPTLLPVPQGDFAAYRPDGTLVYVPVSNEWANWFRYKAGRADDIWTTNLKGQFQRLTDDVGIDTTPVVCGGDVYYVSERTGAANLWRYDPKPNASVAVTKNTVNPVRYPASDGKRIVFQSGFNLAIYDPSSRATKPVVLRLDSDRIHAREQRVRAADSISQFSAGPSGKRVVAQSRGQIVSLPAENGDARVIENTPGARASYPAYSPDGKQIAFVSDRSGENEVWLVDANGGTARPLTKGLQSMPLNLVWSPDSKWIALQDRASRTVLIDSRNGSTIVTDRTNLQESYDSFNARIVFSPDSKLVAITRNVGNYHSGVAIYDIAARKLVPLGVPYISASSPTFSPDGRYLAYLAERDFDTNFNTSLSRNLGFDKTFRVNLVALDANAPSPFLPKNDEEPSDKRPEAKPSVNVTLENLADRTFEAPISAGNYTKLLFTDGKLLLLSFDSLPAIGSGPSRYDLLAFDLDKRKTDTIVSGIDDAELTADGKRLLVITQGKPGFLAADGGPGTPKAVDLASLTLTVQPDAEWRQIVNESWRVARDLFYDPGMHGVDWAAVRTKYLARLALVGDRNDLTQLLKDMVSELNAGHCYVTNPVPGKSATPMGFLGADYEPASVGVKISKLYSGDEYSLGTRSPLLERGQNVKVGDYIVAVAGNPVTKDVDIQKLLIGTANRTITLSVNDRASLDGARTIRVRPLASEAALRYQDWVKGRDAYVKKYGGPNFGYLHVPNMGEAGAVSFTKGQWQQHDQEAVVFDFRYNGGGYVSSMLLHNLVMRPWAYWRPRDGGYWTREDWALTGHFAALCNEFAFSDGELVIETWKHLQLGPVIGKTTGGGEVGSGGGYTLIDGGALYIPNYAAFADGQWLVEGRGASPDIDVDQDPNAVLAGRDPQLDKAIEVLKANLAKNPIKPPAHPAFPKKNG